MTRVNTEGKPSDEWADKLDKKDLKDICKGKKKPNGNQPELSDID